MRRTLFGLELHWGQHVDTIPLKPGVRWGQKFASKQTCERTIEVILG